MVSLYHKRPCKSKQTVDVFGLGLRTASRATYEEIHRLSHGKGVAARSARKSMCESSTAGCSSVVMGEHVSQSALK